MMQGVSEGCRDVVCFTLAKHFRGEKRLPPEATKAILLAWNRNNNPPLDNKTVQAKVISAYKGKGGSGYTSYGCENNIIQPFCDKENCPIFADHRQTQQEKTTRNYFHKNVFIPPHLANELLEEFSFIFAAEQLYIYRSGAYRPIGRDFVHSECRKRLGDGARINRINEVVAHIEDMSRKDVSMLDTHTDLINLQNGMFNWRTLELQPHDKGYLSTIQCSVRYDSRAKCYEIYNFLNSTVPPDCMFTVEELFGYSLIPDARFHKAFMLTGTGRNGKSTFLSLLERFVGPGNVSKVPLQEICEHKFKRAEIQGKLLNLFADLDSKSLRSTSYFKTIVSGDAIDAERKNRDPFFFRPFARLVFSANEIPKSGDKSFAYYYRWIIIPFPNVFTEGRADKEMLAKITQPEELSGWFNHAVKGLTRLMENQDFTESETVRESLDAYKKANDTVLAFVGDRCEMNLDETIDRTKLYNAYTRYCEQEGYKADSRQVCYSRIRAQGISEKKLAKDRLFVGITLR